jgi:hypothetical protein
MSGVLIDGGWSQDGPAGRRHSSHPSSLAFSADPIASTTATTAPGEVVPFPPFSHPAFGYPDFAVSAKRRRSRRRRLVRRMVFGAFAGAVVLGGSGVLVANELGTHDALASARRALAHTREQLARTTSQRDTYQAQLNQAENQLSQAQRSLSSAQNQVNLEGTQITVLKTCLGGVLNSLSFAAVNDYTDAISAINSVSGACNSSAAILPPASPGPASPGPASPAPLSPSPAPLSTSSSGATTTA